MSETQTALIQFQELPAIAANAPAILAKNTKFVNSGINKGQGLLDTIEGEEMTPELDQLCNNYLLEVKKAIDIMNAGRTPITQMLTAIQKEFTRLENSLDKTKPDTVPYKIQEARNTFARAVALKQQQELQQLKNKQLAEEERVNLVAKVELNIREKYNLILYNFKKKYNDLFNSMTLDTVPDITDAIKTMPLFYPQAKFNEIACPVTAIYVKPEYLPGLVYDTRAGLFEELSANFHENMEALKMHLLDQIPARKQELIEIRDAEKKNAAEAKRLTEAAELRQQEEALRLAKENQANENNAIAAAAVTKDVGAAQLSFEKEVAHAEIFSGQTQSVKHSYVIKVTSKIGWQQIAALWFKECSKATAHDKMEKKTLGAMKKDLEVLAFSGGERLNDSAHLVYEQDVKAVTKKV